MAGHFGIVAAEVGGKARRKGASKVVGGDESR